MSSPRNGPIRILLVEEHRIAREALTMLLNSHPDLEVIGEAAHRASALAALTRERPDIILVDINLHGKNGLDLLLELRSVTSQARVVILTGTSNPKAHQWAVQQGALGLILKHQSSEILIKAIKKVHAGEVWLDRSLMRDVQFPTSIAPTSIQRNSEAGRIESLTPREREVMALMCEGLDVEHVAARLGIKIKTVRHHLTSTYDKLGVSGQIGMIIHAFRHGLIKLPG